MIFDSVAEDDPRSMEEVGEDTARTSSRSDKVSIAGVGCSVTEQSSRPLI